MATTLESDEFLTTLAHELVFVSSITVGERGQVAIPADLRRELDLAGGAKLFVLRLQGREGFVVLTAAGLAELARGAPPMTVAKVFGAGANGKQNGGAAHE